MMSLFLINNWFYLILILILNVYNPYYITYIILTSIIYLVFLNIEDFIFHIALAFLYFYYAHPTDKSFYYSVIVLIVLFVIKYIIRIKRIKIFHNAEKRINKKTHQIMCSIAKNKYISGFDPQEGLNSAFLMFLGSKLVVYMLLIKNSFLISLILDFTIFFISIFVCYVSIIKIFNEGVDKAVE